jgi:hypothetical protein
MRSIVSDASLLVIACDASHHQVPGVAGDAGVTVDVGAEQRAATDRTDESRPRAPSTRMEMNRSYQFQTQTRWLRTAVALFASAAGCSDRGPEATSAPMDGNDASNPVADAGSADETAAVSDVRSAGDIGPSPLAGVAAEAAYRLFLEEGWSLQRMRLVDCFGASPRVLAKGRILNVPLRVFEGLRAGLSMLDPVKASSCLDTIRHTSCEDIVAGAIDSACEIVLSGRVATGGFCLADPDCEGPDEYCAPTEDVCGWRCAKRKQTGDACMGPGCGRGMHCVASSVGNERCVPLGAEGASCLGADGCGAELFCRSNSLFTLDGICRPRIGGTPCEGPQQCPYPYTCVFDASNRGTCGVGDPLGTPCRLYGHDAINGPYNDCTLSLYCHPDAQGEWRCGEGVGEGEFCGYLPPPQPGQNGGFIPCRDGFCALKAGEGICRPLRSDGESCTGDGDCGPRGNCVAGVCRTDYAGAAVGMSCGAQFGACVHGAYCAADDPNDLTPTPKATCRATTRDGETCERSEQCGLTSRCIGTLCTPC